MYGSHCPNRSLVTNDDYTYLPKLTVKLKEDHDFPVQKDTNIYTQCIKHIMSGQDKERFERFKAVLEEVGDMVNIPDDGVDMSPTEDINIVQDCEGGF